MLKKCNIVAVAGMASILLIALAPGASANWQGSISGSAGYYESVTWEDQSYSEVRFKDCTSPDSSSFVDVRLWEDNYLSPDTSHGTKKFTNCFNGYDSVSAGEWTGLPLDGYYFSLENTDATILDVRVVAIDTSQAD